MFSCLAFLQHFPRKSPPYEVQESYSHPTAAESRHSVQMEKSVNCLLDHLNENNWNNIFTKSAAIECEKFLITVLLNRAEYKKRKTVRSINSKMSLIHALYFSKIAPRNWSPWNVIDCCNRDRTLTITTQRHKTCSRRCSTLVIVECWMSPC
jgi:hypothetical protein